MTYGMTNSVRPGGGRGPGPGAPTGNAPAGAPIGPNPMSAVAEAFQVVLVDELIPYVDANFRTIANPAHRAMGGSFNGRHGNAYHYT